MTTQEGVLLKDSEVKTSSPLSSVNDRSTNDEEENREGSEDSSSGSSPFELKKRLEDLPSRSEVTRLASRISAISQRLIRKRDIHFHLQGTTDRIEEKDEKEERDQQVLETDDFKITSKDARARRRARIQLESLETKEQQSFLSRSDSIFDPCQEPHNQANISAEIQQQYMQEPKMWNDPPQYSPVSCRARCGVLHEKSQPVSRSPKNFYFRESSSEKSPGQLASPISLCTPRTAVFDGYRPRVIWKIGSESESESNNEISPNRDSCIEKFNSPMNSAFRDSRFERVPIKPVPPSPLYTSRTATFDGYRPKPLWRSPASGNRSESNNETSAKPTGYIEKLDNPTVTTGPPVRFDEMKDPCPFVNQRDPRCFPLSARMQPTSRPSFLHENSNCHSAKIDYLRNRNQESPVADNNTREADTSNINRQKNEKELLEASSGRRIHGRDGKILLTPLSSSRTIPQETFTHKSNYELEVFDNSHNCNYAMNDFNQSNDVLSARINPSSEDEGYTNLCSIKHLFNDKEHLSLSEDTARSRISSDSTKSSLNRTLSKNVNPGGQIQSESNGFINHSESKAGSNSPAKSVDEMTRNSGDRDTASTSKRITAETRFKENSLSEEEAHLSNNEAFLENQKTYDACKEKTAADVPALVLNSQEISCSTSPGCKTYSGKRLDTDALLAVLSTMSANSKLETGNSACKSHSEEPRNDSKRTSTLRSSGNDSTMDGSSRTPDSLKSKKETSKVSRRRRSRIPVKINSATYRASPNDRNNSRSAKPELSSRGVGTSDSETVAEPFPDKSARDRLTVLIDTGSYSYRDEQYFFKVNQPENQDTMYSQGDQYRFEEEIDDTEPEETEERNGTQTEEELSPEIRKKTQPGCFQSASKENTGDQVRKSQDKLRYSVERLAAEKLREYTEHMRAVESRNDESLMQTTSPFRIQPSSSTSRLHHAPDKTKSQYPREKNEHSFTVHDSNKRVSETSSSRRKCVNLEKESKCSESVYKLDLHPSITRLAGGGIEETPAEIIAYAAQTELQKNRYQLSIVHRFMRRFSGRFRKSNNKEPSTESIVEETSVIYENRTYEAESMGNSCSESSIVDLRYNAMHEQQDSNRLSPDKESSIVYSRTPPKKTHSKEIVKCAEHPPRRQDHDNLWIQETPNVEEKKVIEPRSKERSRFFIKSVKVASKSAKNKQDVKHFPKSKRKGIKRRTASLPLILTASDITDKAKDEKNNGIEELQTQKDEEDVKSINESRSGCMCCKICRGRASKLKPTQQGDVELRTKRKSRFSCKKKG